MRIVDIRETLTQTNPTKRNPEHVEAVVGRTLGEVSVEELVHASFSAKPSGEVEVAVQPLREVYLESEEE